MAEQDPKTTIYTIVSTNLGNIKKDDGITNANVLHIWEGGPETLKHLFFVENYDVILSYNEPRSRAVRRIQDVPVHYLMSYQINVTTTDKPLLGAIVCTAVRMQYKVTLALRRAVAASAQSGAGLTPAYTLSIMSDTATHKRIGGLDIYETTHVVEYETDYG